MIATYGGTPAYDLLSIPVDIPHELMLGIKELNFKPVEIEQLVDKFFHDRASLQGKGLQRFLSCIAQLTGGHIGFCVAAIQRLNERFLSAHKSDSMLPTAETWIRSMEQALSHVNHATGYDPAFEAIDLSTAV
ncbi:hypothetical protein PHYSODRAFT_304383 [Phytophthora sojae]|uniref:Uncharacterized protein n=1 Tax=Phytophthora sojae (strain P6497) TaxID=1094619 RepID=G5A0J7_PHYSP|nr:hypothetical protein PHYSODRAFT_304383 [Phytophthora sojae]EGZ10533.1 hypothetical protein PHYSODRAFT_304383 [Phytophthora sojae]|eukprot:XP_009533278.1 hypothetical protein PHYSODRAFT_304383 [Phytophthora sojae]